MADINNIPLETLENIFSNLPFFDLVTAGYVCQRWRSLILYHEKKWHYNRVIDITKPAIHDVHRLLTLYSGPNVEGPMAYQFVGIAQGRSISEYFICTFQNEELSSLAPSRLQGLYDLAGQDRIRPLQSVFITKNQILGERLLRKHPKEYDVSQIKRTEQEQIFYDWMQSYHPSLTWGSETLVSYNTSGDPEGHSSDASYYTTFTISRFCLCDPKYRDMTVAEFIEDAWDDTKSMAYSKHNDSFTENDTSFITITLRESLSDGRLWVWLLSWRARVKSEANP
ncbi:hypothetical protein TWF281_003149 [Arthrobotrys megalospora]